MLPEIETLATVVVCEDDPITRELLCDNLAADRFDPLAAGTAEDALRFCRYGAPDVLLLDIGLPDASGLDVIREIRSADGPAPPFDPILPIVALSGRGADDDRVRGLREGVTTTWSSPSTTASSCSGSASCWSAAPPPAGGRPGSACSASTPRPAR